MPTRVTNRHLPSDASSARYAALGANDVMLRRAMWLDRNREEFILPNAAPLNFKARSLELENL